MPKIIQTVPFNFNDLYAGLSTKFKEAGALNGVTYDLNPGSNTAQLVTAMAYLTSMLNVNTATNINETLLPLATQRNNVLENARAIGYEIQHKQSYYYNLTLTLSGSANGTYTIPKYSVFNEGTHKYYYMGNAIELPNVTDGTAITILVQEGTLFSYVDYPNTLTVTTGTVLDSAGQSIPQYYVDIPFVDIEENGIECFITYFDNFGNLIQNEQWLKSKQFVIDKDLTVKNKFFRLDNIQHRTPRIYFELSGVGAGVKIGTTVNMNVLQTSGIFGAMQDITNPAGITHTLQNITVSKIVLVAQGTDEETLQSIKLNAPKFYNSANRAVTANDYIAICNRQSTVNSTFVWGGNEELPKSPGHIWFSFLPSFLPRSFTPDAHNNLFTLDNNAYTAWDYTQVPSADPINNRGPFEAQYDIAAAYYSSKYIENFEIQSTDYNNAGQVVNPGVWDVLAAYKIPTMQYHNRHPIFVDFEYNINIMKYVIVDSKAVVHSDIFNIIDNYFTGTNETFQAEKYNIEYFHSSLEKRIDAYLTDASGYNNTLKTTVMLTNKNVAQENLSPAHRDVYVPLSVPFEPIFDSTGYLITSVLPNIDTVDFVDYRAIDAITGLPTGATLNAKPAPSKIYTDWSGILNTGPTQISDKIIIAPIRTSLSETIVAAGGETSIALYNINIFPDDPSTLDIGTPTYDKTTVYHISTAGVETILVKGVGCNYDSTVSTINVSLTTPLLLNESIRVQTESMCGNYILFNSFNKYITVQLFVDATGYVDGALVAPVYADPKSYLTTTDQLYDFTLDSYYLTTNGYTVTNPNATTVNTGPVIKAITPNTYLGSPLKMDLFRRNRYLNLNYNSPNFKIEKNLIARLKSVQFN